MGNERRKKVINNEGSKKITIGDERKNEKITRILDLFFFKFVFTSINFFTKKMWGVRILFKR